MHALNKFVNKFVRPFYMYAFYHTRTDAFRFIFVQSMMHSLECTIDATVAHSACAIFRVHPSPSRDRRSLFFVADYGMFASDALSFRMNRFFFLFLDLFFEKNCVLDVFEMTDRYRMFAL